jgi:PAS domain S-box-containing protein
VFLGPITLLLASTAFINLVIGFYVYRINRQNGANRSFAFMAVIISLWTIAIAVAHYGTSGHTWAMRSAFAAASMIPVSVLSFIDHLPIAPVNCSAARRRLFVPIATILSALSFSPWIVVSMWSDQGGPRTEYGILHPFFAAYVIACFAHATYIFAIKYGTGTELQKRDLRYVAVAFAIPAALATTTNVVVPLLFNSSALSRYGPLFSLLLLALLGHAIIRHRVMNIRIVIRRSVVYLAAFGVAGLILVSLLLVSDAVSNDPYRAPLREIVLALTVAVFFSPLKAQIQRAFDRYLYREPYDYQRTIREASRALGDTIELPGLLSYIVGVITKTLKCEGAAIYLQEDDEASFDLAMSGPDEWFPEGVARSSILATRAARGHEAVFRDEIPEGAAPEGRALQAEFGRLRAEVVVPLVERDQVFGLLCVGAKRSGDPYYSDDADLLTTLANQSAVAIRNAQAHRRVVQMNEELQKILSTIESGVIAANAKGKITLFNRAAEQLTGLPARLANGRRVDCLPAPVARLVAITMEDGQSRSQEEFALPDAAGQLVPLVCSTSPLVTPHGATAGVVAVLADLSRLKELEQEKRRAERLASIDAIASGLVHEIRNPLVAIKTFTQLLPTRHQDEEFRDTLARVADREIHRIDGLLTRFRTLSSASAQLMAPVNVLGPLDDTLETLRPRIEEHRLELRRVADGAPRSVLGNASQLEQLFLNLCLNAIEAMEPGGELTVRVADLSEAGGTTLLVEISDTGSGIPDDLLPTIFNPFVTTKAQGTGLGLAICRSIADAHHAQLRARNNVGRPGATFTIEFPLRVGAARARP